MIGDFGFAKQGVDVTRTRLGTPITMAPELLSSRIGSYNNKADLWSIGVCFYQILFGKTPFDAKNYDDLKKKVRSLSGHNLRFPKDVPVSEECRHLLINLLQHDPKKRIEWKDFFNHKLFDLHNNKNNNFGNLTNSMIYRDNEQKVKQEFKNNKKQNIDGKLMLPEQMNTGNISKKKIDEESVKTEQYNNIQMQERYDEAFRYIRARYCHEKKKIIFIMYTVRKLRNLAKLRYLFNNLTEKFMLSACLLLQKGLLLNQNAIKSLQTGYNAFEVKEFDKFLEIDDNQKIQSNFKDDDEIYQTFYNQMNSKFNKEVSSLEFKTEFNSFKNASLGDMESLNSKMENHFNYFLSNLSSLSLNRDLEKQFCLAILHFYYAIKTEKTFSFVSQNRIFEWKMFERENSAENAKNILTTF